MTKRKRNVKSLKRKTTKRKRKIIKTKTKNHRILKHRVRQTRKKNNMYATSVHQWNPFKGCKFACTYCSASFQRQAKRQKHRCRKCYEYVPHEHPERLNERLPKTNDEEFIFVCASGDPAFASYEYFEKTLGRIRIEKDKTFLIQSKNPAVFLEHSFPENVILGTTIETNRDDIAAKYSKAPVPSMRKEAMCKLNHPRKMITIESILKFDLEQLVSWVLEINPEMVWVGYNSKKRCEDNPTINDFKALITRLRLHDIKVKVKTAVPKV